MDTLRQDLRYALRTLIRAPGFTLVAVLTLALGIGANTAMFSVMYGVLLRPLPYPEPERLVGLAQTFRGSTGEMDVTYSQYRFLAEHAAGFDAIAVATPVGLNLFAGGEGWRLDGSRVSRDYFRVLGVAPALGRTFTADEDSPGGPDAAILAHATWRSRFGGAPDIIGSTVSLDGRPFTVVGVMPAGFRAQPDAEVWTTVAQVARTIGSGQNLTFLGRLDRGVPHSEARARFASTAAALQEEFSRSIPRESVIGIRPFRELAVLDLRMPVRVLFGAVALVLLIACANVASLMLGRASARSRELAVRVAMGASGGRVLRQVLVESVVLAVPGGIAGLALAEWGLGVLIATMPGDLSRGAEIRLDGWALAFTGGVTLATGLAFGLVPALRAARTDLHETLKEAAGRAVGSVSRSRLRQALVVAEMALSLVLLAGAGLLLRTFANLVRTDAGFDPGRVAAAEIWLTGSRYDSTARVAAFYQDLTRRLTDLPLIEGAAVVEAGMPLQRGGNIPILRDGEFLASADYRTVTPDYFRTLGVPLLAGRSLSVADAAGAPAVVVVNQSFAGRFLGGEGAVGRTIHVGGSGGADRQVVGVVGDVRSFIGSRPQPTVFLASAQTPMSFTRIFSGWFPIHVLVRSSDPASAGAQLARIIREADPQVPVGRVRTMEDVLASSLAFQRFSMVLVGLFAGLALALAAVGLYGVISFLVSQRKHEIGVRMALGARSIDVLRLVVGRGLLLVAAGAALGLAGSVALTRLLASQLYGVRPTDPATLAGVTVTLMIVALLACLLPARRASTVDPTLALRSE